MQLHRHSRAAIFGNGWFTHYLNIKVCCQKNEFFELIASFGAYFTAYLPVILKHPATDLRDGKLHGIFRNSADGIRLFRVQLQISIHIPAREIFQRQKHGGFGYISGNKPVFKRLSA